MSGELPPLLGRVKDLAWLDLGERRSKAFETRMGYPGRRRRRRRMRERRSGALFSFRIFY
jgi:hypothetical protein